MNKCKIIKRKGMRKLLVKGMKGQQLSEWETNAINTGEIVGLLQVDACKKGVVYNLEFDITGYLTFEEFLQVPLTRDTFARVLDNILENLRAIEEKHFNQQLILYDMDKIFINPSTQRLFFAYVPLQPFESESSLQEMLLNIIQYGAFTESEDSEYVSEYITILNSGINFSVFELEEYVRRLINGEDDAEMVACPKCHAVIPAETVLCKCGFKLHGFTGSTGVGGSQIYDMFQNYKENIESHKSADAEHGESTVSRQEIKSAPPEPETKPKRKKATTVLSLYEDEVTVQAYLIREADGEKIAIDRSRFRVGRESGDYIVANRYVSEPHLEITVRNSRYFAVDLDSTNKTFVNGKAIPPQVETELFSGCQLKLANEKFQFVIE